MRSLPERIGLVRCVKSKTLDPAVARDLYTSALFRQSRIWADANCDRWFILSAKYGLADPWTWLEPYEQTLRGMGKVMQRDWAQTVCAQLEAAGLLQAGTRFVWLAGSVYKDPLSHPLNGFLQEELLSGFPMGKRLSWLTRNASVRAR